MTYEFAPRGHVLFSLGDHGTKCYLLLEGTAGVWINPNPNHKDKGLLREVKVLAPGDFFGELALLGNKARAATIICREDCHFAALEKVHFDQILRNRHGNELQKNMSFFYSVKLFSKLSQNILKKLYLNTDRVNYQINETVYSEGSPSSLRLYVIIDGDYQVTKSIQVNTQDYFGGTEAGKPDDNIDARFQAPFQKNEKTTLLIDVQDLIELRPDLPSRFLAGDPV